MAWRTIKMRPYMLIECSVGRAFFYHLSKNRKPLSLSLAAVVRVCVPGEETKQNVNVWGSSLRKPRTCTLLPLIKTTNKIPSDFHRFTQWHVFFPSFFSFLGPLKFGGIIKLIFVCPNVGKLGNMVIRESHYFN